MLTTDAKLLVFALQFDLGCSETVNCYLKIHASNMHRHLACVALAQDGNSGSWFVPERFPSALLAFVIQNISRRLPD